MRAAAPAPAAAFGREAAVDTIGAVAANAVYRRRAPLPAAAAAPALTAAGACCRRRRRRRWTQELDDRPRRRRSGCSRRRRRRRRRLRRPRRRRHGRRAPSSRGKPRWPAAVPSAARNAPAGPGAARAPPQGRNLSSGFTPAKSSHGPRAWASPWVQEKLSIAGHSAKTSSRWAPPPQATALPRAQPAPDPPKHQIPRSPSSAKCAEPGRQPKVSAKITGRLQVSAKITGRRRKQAAGKPLKVKALTCGARVTAQPEARSNRSKASILGPCIGAFRFEASLGKIVARLYKNDAETKGEAKCPMPNADGLLKMILRCAFVPAGSSQAIGRTCTIVLAYLSSPARPLTRRPASATS